MDIFGSLRGGSSDKPVAEAGTPSAGGDSPNPDLASLAQEARKSGRRASKASKQLDQVAADADKAAEREKLAKLYEGENWEELAAMYFNGRFAWTGDELFLLSDPQRRLLGSTLGTTMQVLLKIDPAYVAIVVLMANMGAIIMDKELKYKRKREKAAPKAPTMPRLVPPVVMSVPVPPTMGS